jgi:hypothetical protein
MMNSRPISVLLMDDEPSSPIIQATLDLLHFQAHQSGLSRRANPRAPHPDR